MFSVGLAQSEEGGLFFSVSPEDHSAVEGSPVRFRCETQSSIGVKYSWKLEGQTLAPSPRRHQVDGDLYITRVNRILDSGNFVCVAYHEPSGYTIESSPAKVEVQCEYNKIKDDFSSYFYKLKLKFYKLIGFFALKV